LAKKQGNPDRADDVDDAEDASQTGAGRRRQGKRGGAAGRAAGEGGQGEPAPQVITIRPMAKKATMRKRHWGVAYSFIAIVLLPLVVIGYYLVEHATDQYSSVAGFSVRQEENTGAAEMLGGLASFVGGGSDGEADMLYQYIQSQDLVAAIDERLDLKGHYTTHYDTDPVFSLKPGVTIEGLLDYWQRIVRVSYDSTTGLITLNVLAFEPEMARTLAQEIIDESQTLVNELNATARADTLRYAEQDLADSVARLKAAREALVHFRTETQIVDPESDLRGRMGVLNSLQQQLAQALIDYDLVAQGSSASDPRVTQALRRIEVIRERISEERATFAADDSDAGTEGYPMLLAEYESLVVDREFAEETYRAALASLDIARANAARQSRYLATYVKPTLPQRADYPQRLIIFGISGLFLLLFWAILSLMFYAVRDRK
jgi:capsular polysaccharide transport system permease protein